MTFSHDTEHALLVVVDLVNTAPECGGVEALPDSGALAAWVRRHHISGAEPSDFSDVTSIHQVRDRFRACFGVDDVEVLTTRVNALVAEAPVRPRLTDHDGYDWHIHYFAPGVTLAEHLAIDGGMALAHVVTAAETDRLRVCEAPDCEAVLLDLSRNRSKRYCDARTCGNRLNVAAYRERKRTAALATGPS
ncbi:MAG TPA: CGNR zinc finger domain-containing protein [Nocardioidaceae bacterium]